MCCRAAPARTPQHLGRHQFDNLSSTTGYESCSNRTITPCSARSRGREARGRMDADRRSKRLAEPLSDDGPRRSVPCRPARTPDPRHAASRALRRSEREIRRCARPGRMGCASMRRGGRPFSDGSLHQSAVDIWGGMSKLVRGAKRRQRLLRVLPNHKQPCCQAKPRFKQALRPSG